MLGTLLSSEPIVADTSPPYLPDGSSVYSGQDFSNQASQVGDAVDAGCSGSTACWMCAPAAAQGAWPQLL